MVVAASLLNLSPIQTHSSPQLVWTVNTVTTNGKSRLQILKVHSATPDVCSTVLLTVPTIQVLTLIVLEKKLKQRTGRNWDKGEKFWQSDGVRKRERGERKSDSFFNIRLAGNVFLHSSVFLCVYFPVAVSFTALGITQLSTDHSYIKSRLTDEGAIQRTRPLNV